MISTLGDTEVPAIHPQINATEPDNPRTWSATSVVQIVASREKHGTNIRCVALHESYAARSLGVDARLDVKCKFYSIYYLYHEILSTFSLNN